MISKLKTKYFNWIKAGPCSCCKKGEFEFITTEDTGILVNIESRGRVVVPGLWLPTICCNNPLCEWSAVKHEVNAHIWTSSAQCWKEVEKLKERKNG